MKLDIDPFVLLTTAQKTELAGDLFKQLKKNIEGLKFEDKPLKVNKVIESAIEGVFNDDYWTEDLDFSKVGKVLVKKIVSNLEG